MKKLRVVLGLAGGGADGAATVSIFVFAFSALLNELVHFPWQQELTVCVARLILKCFVFRLHNFW